MYDACASQRQNTGFSSREKTAAKLAAAIEISAADVHMRSLAPTLATIRTPHKQVLRQHRLSEVAFVEKMEAHCSTETLCGDLSVMQALSGAPQHAYKNEDIFRDLRLDQTGAPSKRVEKTEAKRFVSVQLVVALSL